MDSTEYALTLLLAVVAAYVSYKLRRNDSIGMDEGYLWYGVLRISQGRIPIVDFRAYEPGRYYWCAAWMRLLGNSPAALRGSVHLYFLLGLFATITGFYLAGISWFASVIATLLLVSWAFPAHKLFELANLMFAFLSGIILILHPGISTWFLSGAIIGVIGFFGLNYGLYATATIVSLMALSLLKSPGLDVVPLTVAAACGIFAGSLPLILMMVVVRGFARATIDRRVLAILSRGSTNLSLPIPWPWRPIPPGWARYGNLATYSGRFFFLALPFLGWGVFAWLAFAPWNNVAGHAAIAVAGMLAAFSFHHAISRADLPHLCQVMSPFILGIIAIGDAYPPFLAPMALILAITALLLPLRQWGIYQRRRSPASQTQTLISGQMLWVPAGQARTIELMRSLQSEYLSDGHALLALPTLVTLYPILGLESPVYDTFCIYPANQTEQNRMIEEIRKNRVRLALINNGRQDGREDLRFSSTHPRVWAFLETQFIRLSPASLPRDYHVFLLP